jgi:hypothetical protein
MIYGRYNNMYKKKRNGKYTKRKLSYWERFKKWFGSLRATKSVSEFELYRNENEITLVRVR